MERNPYRELGKPKARQKKGQNQILTCSLGFATCGCLNDTNSAQNCPSLLSMASCTYQRKQPRYRLKSSHSHTTYLHVTTEATFLLPLFIHINTNTNVSF